MIPERWQNQEEALQFAVSHDACMLDMEMGTGKTRVAIDAIMSRDDVHHVLVVCPKAVVPVWRANLEKFAEEGTYSILEKGRESVAKFASRVPEFFQSGPAKRILVVNYDSVWRRPLGDVLYQNSGLDMVVLDESHRAKAAGSKVSKYLAMLGRRVRYRMCLSGTPMANSPLDVYGQYRFLDRSIFGTNYDRFQQQYAILGGPENRFVVGFKNQQDLMSRFQSIAYTCKISDVADRVKLPEALPPVCLPVYLPPKDMRTLQDLGRDFVAECEGGFVTASNVLVKLLRMQQLAAGFCPVQEGPLADAEVVEANTAKRDALQAVMEDLDPRSRLVVFCVFQHDLEAISQASARVGRESFELSGRANTLDGWRRSEGGVIAVQIQAGAEGVDMTCADHAVYFSLPHSLALYEQSRARLYRPGQTRPVSFMHLVAQGTVDEGMYQSLIRKRDVISSIRSGSFDFGYMKR